MAYPAGVQTTRITFGKNISADGTELAVKMAVVPTFTGTQALTWSATGTALLPITVNLTVQAGESGFVDLPVIDQSGWVDDSQSGVTGWSYRLTETISGINQSRVKFVSPVAGQETIDFDLIPTGEPVPQETAPIPPVTSVNGMTGAVVVEGGSGGGGSDEPVGDFAWMGHQWDYRTDPGAPHFNGKWDSAGGITIDDDGYLHLKVTAKEGALHASEAVSTRGPGDTKWGYGRYRWVIGSDISTLPSPVIFGLFTFEMGAPGNNEIDIEAGGWGWADPAWSYTYFRPGIDEEPLARSVGMKHWLADSDPTSTHEFEWGPGVLTWRSWHGTDTSVAPYKQATARQGEEYTISPGNGSTYTGVHKIPEPANEHVIMNLWVHQEDGAPNQPTLADVSEVIIRSFKYEPLSNTTFALDRANHFGKVPATAIDGNIPIDSGMKVMSGDVFDFVNGFTGTTFTSTKTGTSSVGHENPYVGNVLGVVRCMAIATGEYAAFNTSLKSFMNFADNVLETSHYVQVAVTPSVAEDFTARAGFLSEVNIDPIDGAYFELTSGFANWRVATAVNGVRTFKDTGVTANGDWVKLTVRLSTSTATYYINNVEVASIPTVPTGGARLFGVGGTVIKTAGASARTVRWDWVSYKIAYGDSMAANRG